MGDQPGGWQRGVAIRHALLRAWPSREHDQTAQEPACLTSCRSALANQVRLVLHTAAYWLLLTVRDAIAKSHPLATAEFTTLRMRLLKIAGRITETATRVRIAFAAACPEAGLFGSIAISFQPAGP